MTWRAQEMLVKMQSLGPTPDPGATLGKRWVSALAASCPGVSGAR